MLQIMLKFLYVEAPKWEPSGPATRSAFVLSTLYFSLCYRHVTW